jgi:hypothetical protein
LQVCVNLVHAQLSVWKKRNRKNASFVAPPHVRTSCLLFNGAECGENAYI